MSYEFPQSRKQLIFKEIQPNISMGELLNLLSRFNIDINLWGKGEARTIEHLLKEINMGECQLIESNGGLLRLVTGPGLNVFYNDGERILKLKEEKQVYSDGRVRVRADLEISIGEKLKPGESSFDAARRALSEELNISSNLELISAAPITKGPLASVSYPGLKTKYMFEVFDVYLPSEFYKPEGYIEEQIDKKNYYVWVQL
jgi:hypothetical protein